METRSYATQESLIADDSQQNRSTSRTNTARDSDSHLTLGQHARHDTRHHTSSRRDDTRASYRHRDRSTYYDGPNDVPERVGNLEKGLSTVNIKLDRLLDCMPAQKPTHRVRHSTASMHQRPASYYDFEEELQRAEPKFNTEKGKDPVKDFFVTELLPRPYMFIDRPGVRTQKEKAALRETMSFTDYVIGFTAMLSDPRAQTKTDSKHLIAHLNQVARDAHDRPWPQVRDWSDTVFSRVERGDILWTDKAEIQYECMCRSLAPPTQVQNNKTISTGKEVACPDYNARRCNKCRPRESHVDHPLRLIHVCSYCLAAGGQRNPHSILDCEKKLRHAGMFGQGEYQQTPRQTQPMQQQMVANYQPPQRRQVQTTTYIGNQFRQPKNDQQAHVAQ